MAAPRRYKRSRTVDWLVLVAVAAILIVAYQWSGDGKLEGIMEVGIVDVTGPIMGSRLIRKQINYLVHERKVSALVLRIDTPGGAVGASQEIYSLIRRIRKESGVAVVASMGNVAASGGYYIAAAADKIVANRGTITGSIGVIAQFTQVDGLLSRLGLRINTVKSGRFKDMGSPFRDMGQGDRRILQGVIDDTYEQFIDDIVDGRNMNRDSVLAVADGRVMTGRQAYHAGLVDTLGDLDVALSLARKLGGVPVGAPAIRAPKKRAGLIEYLSGRAFQSLGLWGFSLRYSIR